MAESYVEADSDGAVTRAVLAWSDGKHVTTAAVLAAMDFARHLSDEWGVESADWPSVVEALVATGKF